jgi:hypothetical protein
MKNPLTKWRKFSELETYEAESLADDLERISPKIEEAVKNAMIINCSGGGAKQNVTINLTIQVKL